MNDTIQGWEALMKFTGLSDQLLRRSLKLYGFPEPIIVRDGRSFHRLWDTAEVMAWMNAHHDKSFVKFARGTYMV